MSEKEKRDKYLYVPVTPEEKSDVSSMAERLGWSQAAIVRAALKRQLEHFDELVGKEPPGNRRGVNDIEPVLAN